MFEFASPWLLLLLPTPWFIQRFIPEAHYLTPGIMMPTAIKSLFAQKLDHKGQRSPQLRLILLWLAWALLVLSAARPEWLGEPIRETQGGRDLMLVVDASVSMEERDMLLNKKIYSRIEAVKTVLSSFIKQRSSDRLGLIVFATQAYLHAPLTFDHTTVAKFLLETQIGFAGGKTAIGESIILAVKKLNETTDKSKDRVIVLLTDGENSAGQVSPLEAAKVAKDSNVKIYTIGIGANEMLVRSFFGTRKVNPSKNLDESTLTTIANETGGIYLRAVDINSLEEVYEKIDQLEPVDRDERVYRPKQALFIWPLGFAVLLSLLLAIIAIGRK